MTATTVGTGAILQHADSAVCFGRRPSRVWRQRAYQFGRHRRHWTGLADDAGR